MILRILYLKKILSILPNELLYADQKFPPKFLKFPYLSQISPQTSAGLLRFLDVGKCYTFDEQFYKRKPLQYFKHLD